MHLLLSLLLSQTQAADPQAVLDAAQAKVMHAQTVTGSVVFPTPPNGGAAMEMRFMFEKPNRFVTISGTSEMRFDGTTQFILDTKKQEYDLFPGSPTSMPRFAWGFDPFFGLLSGTFSMDHPVAGTFAGKPAVIAEFHNPALRTTVHVAFDPESDLPVGFTLGEGENAHDFTYRDVKLDAPVAKSEFDWKPTGSWQKRVPQGENMLKVGAKAPDFTIATPDGGKTSLSQALKGKKGLLLNFWFVDCNPCRQEFPHLQSMYTGLKGQGFGYLSVNQGDAAAKVTKFIAENKYTFPVALNGEKDADVVTHYGVPAFPTNFIIAPDRTIVARFVGYDKDGLKTAIRKLGLKLN
jgi:peroxiredoxin